MPRSNCETETELAHRHLRAVVDPFAEKIVIYPRPTTGLEAKFSMEYCAAVTWLDGAPSLASFTDERASKHDVQELQETSRRRPETRTSKPSPPRSPTEARTRKPYASPAVVRCAR